METIPSEMIDELCTLSDRQLDESLKPKLQALKGREDIKEELLNEIIGPIINYSLASGFVLAVLQTVYAQLGGKIEDSCGTIVNEPVSSC